MWLLLLILCITSPQSLAETIPASDSRITYVGRTQVQDSSVSFDWTATTIRVRFVGKHLTAHISDTGRNRYNVYIDRSQSAHPDAIVETQGDTTLVLYKGKRGEHEITLIKRTEGEQGRTTVHSFTASSFLLATPHRPWIEYIGDSYSCGYGSDGADSTARFAMETESVCKAFPMMVADSLQMDAIVIAHSGMGVIRNYNSKFTGWTMPLRYLHTFDMDSTDASLWYPQSYVSNPQMTIVCLGGNDFSVGVVPDRSAFVQGYIALLQQIKANYGTNHPILCCVKVHDQLLTQYVAQVVDQSGMTNVEFLPFNQQDYLPNGHFRGADSHPNEYAHQRLARHIIAKLNSIGWLCKGNGQSN